MMIRIRNLSLGAIIIFLLFSGSALAQILKWTDEKGNVYFTDDMSKVPEKYRFSMESKPRGSGAYKSGAEPEGFRGINWGTDLSMLSDMVPLGSDSSYGEINTYLRNGDELTIGAASLERIEYGFWKDKFRGVKVLTKGYSNWTGLRDVMFEKFGKGYLTIKDPEEYFWPGEKTNMILQYDRTTTIGILFMVSKIMGKEIDKDRRQKNKEGAKKGF
jgi:hypothetical protein